MKVLHTADWHIGTFKGPEKDGVNLRSLDTKKCLEAMVEKSREEKPELVLVSGDIFHLGRTWSDRCCKEVILAMRIINELAAVADHVIVMRGTPNHDGEGPFEVLSEHFAEKPNVYIVMEPMVIQTEQADIAVLPGFDVGVFRSKFSGMGKEEENEAISQELGNIVMGMKSQCRPGKVSILMAHYTVPGCNTESGQSQILTQFEPIVPVECLEAANYDLVALGHIHRPQELKAVRNAFYSGSINANNFNDEGQERGFWIHESLPFDTWNWNSTFYKTPYREFLTYHFTDTDVTAIIYGHIDEVAMNYWRWNRAISGKIVRVLYECSAEKKKAFNIALLEKVMYDDGAFWVSDILPEKIETVANRMDMSEKTDPEENLRAYLEEKQFPEEDIGRLILKARPIIAEVMANDISGAFSGMFVPIEIEVKNYRAYAEEKFNFEDIQFCTINGQNGAGKSSLFMDAIIDCLFEEPREGRSTSVKVPWLRNDEKVRSGYISFTFSIGDAVYRVVRTRTKSGKGTLNLAELVAGEWEDRSKEKFNDTQADIEKLIGVDSLTFRSCALIMQDQYGLFLQAKKEERMVILGNLLGLGIYGDMEDIAKNLAADKNRIIAGKKNSVKVQNANILAAGKPFEELAGAEDDLSRAEQRMKEKNLELQRNEVLLATKKEAQERRNKLLEGIRSLNQKKATTGQDRGAERDVIAGCDAIIAGEPEIAEKVAKYHKLDKRAGELIKGATLYSQTSELDGTNKEIALTENELTGYRKQMQSQQAELVRLESRTDAEEIRKKAALYAEKKKQLDVMYLKRQEYDAAANKKDRASYMYDSKKAFFNEREHTLNAEEASFRKRTELLADAGCIDIANAGCRFLADAIQAKKELESIPDRRMQLQTEKESALGILKKEMDAAREALEAVEYDQREMVDLQAECGKLRKYEAALAQLQEEEKRIALIRASVENIRLNISKAEERLSTLKIKAQRLTEEREKHREAYLAHSRILEEMEGLKPWLDKEKELPVTKERRANAIRRMDEMEKTLAELDKEISEKQIQADAEMQSVMGLDGLEQQSSMLAQEVQTLNDRIGKLQIRIGGLRQKISEIRRMQENIQATQKEINELSVDAADYEQLKLSFSQDGIPHQIIRSIIPKLSATANSILSQMTGGQLGVEFRTEKVLKSNSKKEAVTLDIFIEEYGKSSLPYLSKSGGEKVKSSLSVILALAEIKSSTAGIQFGMLFIDEPPFLDSDGIQAYCDALETIGVRYPGIKIMAITHDPTMKARFPQNLDVVKTENGSKVVY